MLMDESKDTQTEIKKSIEPATEKAKQPGIRQPKKKLVATAVILVAILLIAGVIALISQKDESTTTYNDQQNSSQANNSSSPNENPWLADCEGDEKVMMSRMPMDLKDVQSITPIGLTAGAHVTPIDHLYFYPTDMTNRDAAPVYAMADGFVVDISKREINVDSGTERPPEYRIAMQHSCQTVSYFDLMTSLSDKLMQQFEEGSSLRIPITAGEEVGRVGAQSLDTAVYNFSMTLPGFISPEKYAGEFWKVHTDDFFSYFEGEDRTAMLAKNIRKAEPLSGKIDYDQPGKLIGNWFREGTDYSGNGSGLISQDGKRGYWSGHLAIFYFVADPSIIVVSLGEYGDGSPQAFAVKGNAPDPATIDSSSGIVAYELVQQPTYTPEGRLNTGSQHVMGTVLFQVMDGEKLKVEASPGKTKTQATTFTDNAQIYER